MLFSFCECFFRSSDFRRPPPIRQRKHYARHLKSLSAGKGDALVGEEFPDFRLLSFLQIPLFCGSPLGFLHLGATPLRSRTCARRNGRRSRGGREMLSYFLAYPVRLSFYPLARTVDAVPVRARIRLHAIARVFSRLPKRRKFRFSPSRLPSRRRWRILPSSWCPEPSATSAHGRCRDRH